MHVTYVAVCVHDGDWLDNGHVRQLVFGALPAYSHQLTNISELHLDLFNGRP